MHLNLKIHAFIVLLFISAISCRKVKEYFHDPETETIAHALKTSAAIGYSVSVAMSVMSGEQLPFVITTGDCSDFPCTSLSIVTINDDNQVLFSGGNIGEITIAAFRSNEDAAILTMLFTDINISTQNFTLLSIHTIPVITKEGRIIAIFSENDINIGADSDTLLNMDLSQREIDFEMARLENDTPGDLYVAVEQNAWIIGIDQNSTPDNFRDDSYLITGGGQMIEATSISGGILQQAMLSVELSYDCPLNPVDGFALIKNTSTEDKEIPELGTAVLQFKYKCNGRSDVVIATGVYIKSNGKSVPLSLD